MVQTEMGYPSLNVDKAVDGKEKNEFKTKGVLYIELPENPESSVRDIWNKWSAISTFLGLISSVY